MIRQIIANIKPVEKCLSLPADNFIFEKLLLEHNPSVKLMCCEKDEEVWEKGKQQLTYFQNPYYINCNIESVLKVKGPKYDMIYLDLCTMTDKAEEVFKLVQGKFTKDAVVALTFMGARETTSPSKTVKRKSQWNDATRIYRIENIAKSLGLRTYRGFRYVNNSSPMFTFIFRTNVKRSKYQDLTVIEYGSSTDLLRKGNFVSE